ncbi:MAG: choice-of-anchor B family protein [Woeseiaceae bacterium]
MTRYLLGVLPAIALLGSFGAALADSDEPPLFVASDGIDSGSCQDAAAPCRTIDYALKRVGKHGQIRVADGSFELANVEDVVYLLSGAIDVRGGFRRSDEFAASAGAASTLIGVPVEFADELLERGFRVIADSKGIDRQDAAQVKALVESQASVAMNTSATTCSGGFAGAFPCDSVDLLAHISDRTPAARGADIWGFIDLNSNREYAIIGYSVGTAVYDVSDPENPREVGFVDGQSTTWRDIKVYQSWNSAEQRWDAYAYVTADNASDGLFIIDLRELPQRISRINYSSDFAAAHNVYLSGTEFSTGLSLDGMAPMLVLAGPNRSDGRFRSYDLSNPQSPNFVAAPATPAGQPGDDRLYMHDAASMRVTDARKDTQCVSASGSPFCEILFDFNESTVDIWDVTLPSNPVRLSRTPYANADYVHSGWWSEDKQYLFVQDETDERDRGLSTTLRVFSIGDLAAPSLAGTWTGPTTAIDHNGFVRGNRYYMSNYARGLTILDISNPAQPDLVGHFDTYPASDTVGFPGAWGAFPFLPSGNVLISDIDSGFYIVADNTLNAAEGTLAFAAPSFSAEEAQQDSVVVRRIGGTQGDVSVAWELVGASASADDVAAANGTLAWGPGDDSDRIVAIAASNDGVAEGLERFVIRLVAPSGGATLSAPNVASVYVSDPGATSAIEFSTDTISAPERGFATAVAIVNRTGSASGAASVDFAISNSTATATSDFSGPQNGTLSWADGDADPKWIEYTIVDDGAGESDEFIELTLSNPAGAAMGSRTLLRIDVVDGSGINEAPNSVAGASQTVTSGATVTLDGRQSNDPNGDTLGYAWTQSLGPTVTLTNADSSQATFTAPVVNSDTLFRFSLQVTDNGGLSDTATASVTVRSSSVNAGGGGGSGGGTTTLWFIALLALVAARRSAVDRYLLFKGV